MKKKRSTTERRERVRELWGKRDRVIADILFEEGFVDVPPRCGTTKEAELKEGLRRNICNDRIAIRNEWRSTRKQLNLDDLHIESNEYIAKLQTRIYDLEQLTEMLAGNGKGATAFVNAMAEIRQLEELIAKAKGSAVPIAPPEPEDANRATPVTVVFDFSECSAETIAEIKSQYPEHANDDGSAAAKG